MTPTASIKQFAVGDTIDLRGVKFDPTGGAFLDVSPSIPIPLIGQSTSNPVLEVFENNTVIDLIIGDPASQFSGLDDRFHETGGYGTDDWLADSLFAIG